MRDAVLVGGCFVLALLSAAVASAITESPALLGITPIGIAIYLVVGVGLPQSLLARRTGSGLQRGLAALAVAGGAIAAIVGVATGSPNAELSGGVVAILLVVVLGNAIGAVIRQFRDGYRSAAGE